ncbi:MAG: hypothetical protein ACLP1X_30980 [Polyangiaceae bacterium]
MASRPDISDWVIHFVRDRDPEDFPARTEAELDLKAGRMPVDANAFWVLKTIIEDGGLRPGFSLRNEKTTIYGGRPAVCFTEMPLYSLALYARERATTRCTPYGAAVTKLELYRAGGRQVIYGLSEEGPPSLQTDTQYGRLLVESALPRAEQYRYVAYNPDRDPWPLDWTHEREWRWAPRSSDQHTMWVEGASSVERVAALPLFRGKEHGGAFSRVALLVQAPTEAEDVANLLGICRDSGWNNMSEVYDPDVLASCLVIPMGRVVEAVEAGDARAARLDTIPSELCVRVVRPPVSQADKDRVSKAVANARAASASAVAAHKLSRPDFEKDCCGFAQVVDGMNRRQARRLVRRTSRPLHRLDRFNVPAAAGAPSDGR